MTDSQREAILAIKDLLENKRLRSNQPGLEELKAVVDGIKDWCKYDLPSHLKERLGKGEFASAYEICLTNVCRPPMVVRITLYEPGYDTLYKNERPENAEWLIHKALYRTLTKYHVYNIVIPIFSYTCKMENVLPDLEYILEPPGTEGRKGNYPDCMRVTFTSLAEGGSLGDFLKNHSLSDKQLLHLILQILLTLCTIYKDYPNYRHNDLHIGNLLLVESIDGRFKYNIDGRSYTLKPCNTMVLLNDFDYSQIYPGYINSKINVQLPDIKKSVPSSYYDTHKLINSLLSLPLEYEPRRDPLERISLEVTEFLREIVPIFLRGRTKRDWSGTKYVHFFQIMDSKAFEEKCKEKKFNYENYTPEKLIKHKIFKSVLM